MTRIGSLPNFQEENKLWKKGYRLVIGVDEVGRGAFAGPVVAGACAFVPKFQISNFKFKIDDSKRLRPKERKEASKWIKKNCLCYGIGKVGVRMINKVGIGRATQQAMRCSIAQLLNCYIAQNNNQTMKQSNNCQVLVDAFHIKYLWRYDLVLGQKAIKGGDRKSISIAAASILAKVYRDNLMQKFSKRYREYHFGRNKGYGTRKHQRVIIKKGITVLHRKKFIDTFLAHHATIAK